MTAASPIEPRWARAGVLFACAPAPGTPDLERLLLDTARTLPDNARLFPLVVSWLVAHGDFVARHRLRRLVTAELEPSHRPALGLILESARARGAPRDLAVPLQACSAAPSPRPLFKAHAAQRELETLAERTASELSRRWGVWAPEPQLKADAVRPVQWILEKNPRWRDRALRKGDLRCSIVESLRLDAGGQAKSESELARLSGASRAAVRKAVAALMREGDVFVGPTPGNARDHAVVLRSAA